MIEGVEVDAVAIAVGEDLCACKTRTILPGACWVLLKIEAFILGLASITVAVVVVAVIVDSMK